VAATVVISSAVVTTGLVVSDVRVVSVVDVVSAVVTDSGAVSGLVSADSLQAARFPATKTANNKDNMRFIGINSFTYIIILIICLTG
jgi:hypothetical protein